MAIVITGIGVQSPLGCTLQEAMQHVARGTRCVSDIESFDASGFPMKAAGEVRSEGRVVHTPSDVDRKIFFLNRALEQLEQATGFRERYAPAELVMNMGCGVDYVDIERFFNNEEFLLPPFSELPAHHKTDAQIRELARLLDIRGGCHVFVAACVASTQAMGLSLRMLRRGTHRAAITGGSESMISHINYIGFFLLGAMAPGASPATACKPFDRLRRGTILGEGALTMLLERSEYARPESILAEIAGYGATMDAFAITDPEPSAARLARAIELALEDAGIPPDQIDCAHLHGTGTLKNDPAEYLALRKVFGERASTLPVYSLKGQMGHLIGSCGAMEMLGVIHTLQHQEVLPTVNFSEPDPEVPLNVIQGEPLSLGVRYVLKLNSAFGGQNTAFVIKKYEP